PAIALFTLSLHDALPIFCGGDPLLERRDHALVDPGSLCLDAARTLLGLTHTANGVVEFLLKLAVVHLVDGFGPPGAQHRSFGLRDRKSTRLNSSHQIISY